MKKYFYLAVMILISIQTKAQIVDVTNQMPKTGTATVFSSAGRTSCEWVQLWENGTRWATFNVGATITDYQTTFVYYNTDQVGGLYAWGDPNLNMRVVTNRDYTINTGLYDVATALWGNHWKTPTYEQLDTLRDSTYTSWTWCDGSTTQYVSGCKLKGYKVSGVGDYANCSIFLPAAGTFSASSLGVMHDSEYGYYWSSTKYDNRQAYRLYFYSSPSPQSPQRLLLENDFQRFAFSVRAVLADIKEAPHNVSITLSTNGCNAANVITCVQGQQIRINAVVDAYGYHFSQWNDGNIDNPRQIKVTGDKTYTAQFDKNTYYITKIANSTFGLINGSSSSLYQDKVSLSAIANNGYHFTQWSDGNTDNPRSFILTQDTAFEALFAMNYSGTCGDNLYWQYSKGVLTITGSGEMYDEMPWFLFADSISQVNLPAELTTIGAGCFQNMVNLSSIVILASVTNIGANAFTGCLKLNDVYCLAPEPPAADISSFTNYNVYLRVPCDNLRDYQMDTIFGLYKYIECISASKTSTTSVSVVSNTNSADFTWPTQTDASTYTIEIKKDGITLYTLIFNTHGQLTSIAYAPDRGCSNNVNAIEVAGGYKFTITNLNPNTTYTYNIDTKNASGLIIQSYTGTFTTNDATVIEATFLDKDRVETFKIIRNNHLLILRNGKTFNAVGVKIE